jgi:hypothetical protein
MEKMKIELENLLKEVSEAKMCLAGSETMNAAGSQGSWNWNVAETDANKSWSAW